MGTIVSSSSHQKSSRTEKLLDINDPANYFNSIGGVQSSNHPGSANSSKHSGKSENISKKQKRKSSLEGQANGLVYRDRNNTTAIVPIHKHPDSDDTVGVAEASCITPIIAKTKRVRLKFKTSVKKTPKNPRGRQGPRRRENYQPDDKENKVASTYEEMKVESKIPNDSSSFNYNSRTVSSRSKISSVTINPLFEDTSKVRFVRIKSAVRNSDIVAVRPYSQASQTLERNDYPKVHKQQQFTYYTFSNTNIDNPRHRSAIGNASSEDSIPISSGTRSLLSIDYLSPSEHEYLRKELEAIRSARGGALHDDDVGDDLRLSEIGRNNSEMAGHYRPHSTSSYSRPDLPRAGFESLRSYSPITIASTASAYNRHHLIPTPDSILTRVSVNPESGQARFTTQLQQHNRTLDGDRINSHDTINSSDREFFEDDVARFKIVTKSRTNTGLKSNRGMLPMTKQPLSPENLNSTPIDTGYYGVVKPGTYSEESSDDDEGVMRGNHIGPLSVGADADIVSVVSTDPFSGEDAITGNNKSEKPYRRNTTQKLRSGSEALEHETESDAKSHNPLIIKKNAPVKTSGLVNGVRNVPSIDDVNADIHHPMKKVSRGPRTSSPRNGNDNGDLYLGEKKPPHGLKNRPSKQDQDRKTRRKHRAKVVPIESGNLSLLNAPSDESLKNVNKGMNVNKRNETDTSDSDGASFRRRGYHSKRRPTDPRSESSSNTRPTSATTIASDVSDHTTIYDVLVSSFTQVAITQINEITEPRVKRMLWILRRERSRAVTSMYGDLGQLAHDLTQKLTDAFFEDEATEDDYHYDDRDTDYVKQLDKEFFVRLNDLGKEDDATPNTVRRLVHTYQRKLDFQRTRRIRRVVNEREEKKIKDEEIGILEETAQLLDELEDVTKKTKELRETERAHFNKKLREKLEQKGKGKGKGKGKDKGKKTSKRVSTIESKEKGTKV